MSAEGRTLDLVNRNPRIKQELLERVRRGQIPELEQHRIDGDRFASFVPGATCMWLSW